MESIGTAQFDGAETYSVTQSGVTYTLPSIDRAFPGNVNGIRYRVWSAVNYSPAGSSLSFGDTYTAVAGLVGTTYFAGLFGIPNAAVPVGAIAHFSGVYSFIVDGFDEFGAVDLTANFATGVLFDTTATWVLH